MDAGSCSGASPAVYWADVGAGTAVLADVDNCYFAPRGMDASYNYQSCEFGDPTLPILCDCACQTP